MTFDAACRTMYLDICKRHGLELDEKPAYGGRAYWEKQDFIRMKQKEEIAHQDNMIEEQRKRVTDTNSPEMQTFINSSFIRNI